MDTQIQQHEPAEKKPSKFVHVSIIIAIVIVLNLLSNYAVSLVYKEPVYDNFVKPTQVVEEISTKEK